MVGKVGFLKDLVLCLNKILISRRSWLWWSPRIRSAGIKRRLVLFIKALINVNFAENGEYGPIGEPGMFWTFKEGYIRKFGTKFFNTPKFTNILKYSY